MRIFTLLIIASSLAVASCREEKPTHTAIALADSTPKPDTPLIHQPRATLERIFNSYVQQEENTEFDENKDSVTRCMHRLTSHPDSTVLPVIINMWMYYDPTDFPTRSLIEPVFMKNTAASLRAIDKRIRNKKPWEDVQTSPYTDLLALRDFLKPQGRQHE